MKLEIESPEELEAARVAIEEFRKTKIRHVGKYANRMKLQCESTTRERALANGWIHENTHKPGINGGHGALELLLCSDEQSRIVRELTPDEATAAATVIQWLGSHCGWSFLCESLRTAGYTIRKDKS